MFNTTKYLQKISKGEAFVGNVRLIGFLIIITIHILFQHTKESEVDLQVVNCKW